MNRGQNRGSGDGTPAWLAALCAGLCLATLAGTAFAATGKLRATAQAERSWESYFGVAVLPSGRAVVVGDKGVVMTTDDQGRTWTRRKLSEGDINYDLYSVAFTSDGSRGWLVGDHGSIFRSDDGGETWKSQNSKTTDAIMKVAVASASTVCAAGEHGAILCTSDGGDDWNLQKFQDTNFFDIAFVDPSNVYAVGEFQTLLHSGDGGKDWKVQSGGDRMTQPDPLFGLAFADGQNGLAVGLTGDAATTRDGGKTWSNDKLPIEQRSLYTVVPIPGHADTYYAGGENGVAALITDGHLSQVQSGTSNAISGAAFSPRFGMAVGLAGTILLSDDGGQHWHPLNKGDDAQATAR